MALDAKNIQVCLWRVFKGSMNLCYSFVKKYPLVSGTLLSVIFVYSFLPTVFTFLVYSSPVLVISGGGFRVYRRRNVDNSKENEKRNDGLCSQKHGFVEGDGIVYKHDKNASAKSETAIRRNINGRSNEGLEQGGVVEKGMVSSTLCNDDLVDKTALVEESPKEIREVKVECVGDRGESSCAASKHPKPETCGGSVESSEDEEEAQEDRNKAVEWNEDDQKNLMDLGISEIERNRRLESLIAKRRARKLLSLQIRRTLMNLGNNDPRDQIASLLIPKTNSIHTNDSGDSQFSPMPGSAPSVLLPMKNPFDLPYEPHEEKPDLMGDSFHQEFMAAQQKEVMFCRHESFSLGAFFPGDFKQHRHEPFWSSNYPTKQRYPEMPRYSGLRNQSDSSQGDTVFRALDLARLQGQTSQQESNFGDTDHDDERNEVQTKRRLTKDVNGCSSSSSSSEANEPFFNANNEVLKSLSFSVPRNTPTHRDDNSRTDELLFDSSPSAFDRIRMEERFFHSDKGAHHTPTHSIASDLQVEVSEISSPAIMSDGTISPADRESLIAELEKETASGSEKLWVASAYLSEAEENESRSRQVYEETHHPPENHPVGSANDRTEILGSIKDVDCESPILIKRTTDLGLSVPPQEHDSKSSKIVEGKLEGPENPLSKSTAEYSGVEIGSSEAKQNSNDPVALAEQPEVIVACGPIDSSSSPPESLLQKAIPTYQVSSTDLDQTVQVEAQQFGDMADKKSLDELSAENFKPTVSQNALHSTEGSRVCPSHSTDPQESQEPSNPPGNREANSNLNDPEVEMSGASHSLNDPIELVELPELVVEQVPVASSSSSSPTSVLHKKFSMDQTSSLSFDQELHMEDQQLETEMVVNNYFVESPSDSESFAPSARRNAHLEGNSTAPSPASRETGKPQESSRISTKSTEEPNTIYIENESVVIHNKGNETSDSRSDKDIEGKSENPALCEESVAPSTEAIVGDPEDKTQRSVITEIVIKSLDSAEEIDSRSTDDTGGDSKNLTEIKAVDPSKLAGENGDSSNPTTSMKGEEQPSRPIEEAKIISSVNEVVVSEGESQNSIGQETLVAPLDSTEVEKPKNMEETEGKLSEVGAKVGASDPAGENDNLRNKKDTEESGKLTDHENVTKPAKPGQENYSLGDEGRNGESTNMIEDSVESDKSIYHNDVESSKPIESGGKVPNLEIEKGHTKPHMVNGSLGDMEDRKGDSKDLMEDKAETEKFVHHNGVVESSKPTEPGGIIPNDEANGGHKEPHLVTDRLGDMEDKKGESKHPVKDNVVSDNSVDLKGVISSKTTESGGNLPNADVNKGHTQSDVVNDSVGDVEDRKGEPKNPIKDNVESNKSVNPNGVTESSKPAEAGGKVPMVEVNEGPSKSA